MPARRRSYSRKRFPRRRSGPVRRTYKRRTSTRRVSRTTRSRSACVCPGDLAPATKFALAQLDPFHSNAMGAKVPDSNTQPSVSTTDTEQVTLLSAGLATDLFGMAFRPQYTWGTVTATPGGSLSWGGTYTVNSLNRSKRAAYAAAIELTRPVAHAVGCRLHWLLRPQVDLFILQSVLKPPLVLVLGNSPRLSRRSLDVSFTSVLRLLR